MADSEKVSGEVSKPPREGVKHLFRGYRLGPKGPRMILERGDSDDVIAMLVGWIFDTCVKRDAHARSLLTIPEIATIADYKRLILFDPKVDKLCETLQDPQKAQDLLESLAVKGILTNTPFPGGDTLMLVTPSDGQRVYANPPMASTGDYSADDTEATELYFLLTWNDVLDDPEADDGVLVTSAAGIVHNLCS